MAMTSPGISLLSVGGSRTSGGGASKSRTSETMNSVESSSRLARSRAGRSSGADATHTAASRPLPIRFCARTVSRALATSRRTSSRPSPLLIPLAVAAGLTLLQLIPLPIAIAEQVASAKLALVRGNAAAWGDPQPTWVMASYDPPATLVELAKLIGYLALAYTCVRLAAIRRARHLLAMIVVGAATAVAVVTLVHHAAGLAEVYGL